MKVFDLEPRILANKNAIEQGLGKYFHKSILFGSYARGEQNEFSEIDILVLINGSKETLNGFRPFF